jgi:SAM-dependent methyltransferase
MIKELKRVAKQRMQGVGARLLGAELLSEIDRASSLTKTSQIMLGMKFKELVRRNEPLPSFQEVEFRTFSQCGEDGILFFIFSVVGSTNRTLLDLGCGNGLVANSTNLLVYHGWNGLLIDGSDENVAMATEFFARCRDTACWPPKVVQSWIDVENINRVVAEAGLAGSIDLFSMDIDGCDYWIWDALDQVQPRVVVLEYMDILGPDRAWTVPYRRDFVGEHDEMGLCYGGASLPAFVKLGRRKGYRLVGCQQYGFNAFFLRNDVAPDLFPEVPAESCFTHPKVQHGMKARLERVIHKPWVEV